MRVWVDGDGIFQQGPQYELRLGGWKVGGKQWDKKLRDLRPIETRP